MHVTIAPTSQASGQVLLTTPSLHIPQMLFPAAPTPPPKASANGPLRPDPPIASADPDSISKEPHSKGGNDPTLSAGRVDNALKGGNAGDNLDPTPTLILLIDSMKIKLISIVSFVSFASIL